VTSIGNFQRASIALLLLAWAFVALLAIVALTGASAGGALGWIIWWNYNIIEVLLVAACLAGAIGARTHRRPRLVMAAAVVLYTAGDLYYALVLTEREIVPYPSIADALYLGFPPAAFVALVLLMRKSGGARASATVWLDAGIAAVGLAAVAGALLFPVLLAQTGGPAATVATNLAYPLADVLLLVLVVGAIAALGWRPGRELGLVAAALGLFALFDTIYLYETASGTYVEGTLLDAGWPAALALFATASVLPWRERRTATSTSWATFVVPVIAGAASLALLVVDHWRQLHYAAVLLATATVAAVIIRFGVTFVEHVQMLRASRVEALTDALTGLGNRRALLRDLDAHDFDAGGVLAVFDLDGFKPYNDTFGHPAGDELLARIARKLADAAPQARAYRMGGDEFCVLSHESDVQAAAQLIDAATHALGERGELFEVQASFGLVILPDDARDPVDALRIADQRMYAQKASRRAAPARQAVDALLRAVHERDGQLGQHGDGVAEHARAVAQALGLPSRCTEHVSYAAELHDIGKLALPDAILHKPAPLDEAEWAFMRRHPEIGQRIVGHTGALADVGVLIRASHERWDGSGYPDGLRGEEIPMGSRIVATCDAYDAMRAARPYASPMTHGAALAELWRGAGSQFDPAVVEAFCTVLNRASAPAADATALAACAA
jgi:two-component system, cell cycle response regulator